MNVFYTDYGLHGNILKSRCRVSLNIPQPTPVFHVCLYVCMHMIHLCSDCVQLCSESKIVVADARPWRSPPKLSFSRLEAAECKVCNMLWLCVDVVSFDLWVTRQLIIDQHELMDMALGFCQTAIELCSLCVHAVLDFGKCWALHMMVITYPSPAKFDLLNLTFCLCY